MAWLAKVRFRVVRFGAGQTGYRWAPAFGWQRGMRMAWLAKHRCPTVTRFRRTGLESVFVGDEIALALRQPLPDRLFCDEHQLVESIDVGLGAGFDNVGGGSAANHGPVGFGELHHRFSHGFRSAGYRANLVAAQPG